MNSVSGERRRARRRETVGSAEPRKPRPEDLLESGIPDSVRRLASKMRVTMRDLGRLHEVDDLVQDVLRKAIENFGQFGERSSLKTWVCGLARRHFIDLARRAKLRPVAAGDAVEVKPSREIEKQPELRRDAVKLVTWLKEEGRAEVPGGAEILTLLINSGADWDYTSGAMTTYTGRPWTTEAVKGAVRRIKRTDKGRALCEVLGAVDDEEEEAP